MVPADLEFIHKILNDGLINSPCLELGTGYEGETCRELIVNHGIQYFGTDMKKGERVDFVANFEDPPNKLSTVFKNIGGFSTILALNVLEHTFNPIRVLDNIVNLLVPNGICILVTPVVWSLHDFPYDCWRINPNFYEEYCRRNKLQLIDDYFEYVGFCKVRESKDFDSNYQYPKPWHSQSKLKVLFSRTVHKLFNTHGRGMFMPSHFSVGVVIRK